MMLPFMVPPRNDRIAQPHFYRVRCNFLCVPVVRYPMSRQVLLLLICYFERASASLLRLDELILSEELKKFT